LDRIEAEDGWMFFTHDARVAAAKVGHDDRGRYRAVEPLERVDWR
jgi:hypothetical protein